MSEEPTRDFCQEGSPSNVLVSVSPYVASWYIGSFPSLKGRWYDRRLLVSWDELCREFAWMNSNGQICPLLASYSECWALTPPIPIPILPSLTSPHWQNGQLCTLIVPIVNRVQNKQIHPLAKSTIGRRQLYLCVHCVSLLMISF